MNKRWIGMLALLGFFFCAGVQPSMAGLSEACFTPLCSATADQGVDGQQYYVVKHGDTLWDIADRYQMSAKKLMEKNGLNEKSILKIGDRLLIPGKTGKVYTISQGETLWAIARQYGIPLQAVLAANPGIKPQTLNTGQRLIIPDRDSSRLISAASQSSRSMFPSELMVWPLLGTITSPYGWRQSGFHHGIDIAAELGSPIRAASGGDVCYAGYKAVYGRTIVIKHGDGMQTVYAHLDKILVSENQAVQAGQVIATVGITGRTTGPHLHFEVRQDDKTQNPLQYLRK